MRQLLAAGHAANGGININAMIIDAQFRGGAAIGDGAYSNARAVAWSSGGDALFIGGRTSTPFLTKINTSNWSAITGLPALSTQVNALDCSPDGTMVAVGYYNSPWLHIRSSSTLALIAAPTAGSRVHGLSWSRDGSRLAIALLGSPYLRVLNTSDWSVVSGTPTLAGPGYGLAWGPDDETLVVLHQSSPLLRVLNTSDWSTVTGTPTNPGGGGIGIAAAWSPDDSRVALGFQGSTYLRILDPATWSIVASPAGIAAAVTDLSFSKDGSYLAVSFQGGAGLAIYKTADWSMLTGTPVLPANGYAARFSPLLDEPDSYVATRIEPHTSAAGWSGPDSVSATVKQVVGESTLPMRAKVNLLRKRDRRLVAQRWSDAATGAVVFRGLDGRQRYVALAEHPTNPDDPAADNYMRPVAGVSRTRGEA